MIRFLILIAVNTGVSLEGISQMGTMVGMVLPAIGGQLVDVPLLLPNLTNWKDGLLALAEDQPECRPAVQWLLGTLMAMSTEPQVSGTKCLYTITQHHNTR